MDLSIVYELAAANPNHSDIERLGHLYQLLSQTVSYGVRGDVLEVGCNAGGTSVFLRRILRTMGSDKRLIVFDSFAGLPAPGKHDAYLSEGDCKAGVQELIQRFRQYDEPLPVIAEGWIADTLPRYLPAAVSFAYIDLDFYEATRFALESIYKVFSPGGILCVDDYCDLSVSPRAWDGLPGVKVAMDEFLRDKPEQRVALAGVGDLSMCFVRKAALS